MKLRIVNRQGDAFPMLDVTAENDKEGQQLKDLLKDMGKVQEYGIECGVATEGCPPCGNSTHHYAVDSISVRVILGQGSGKHIRDFITSLRPISTG